MPKDKEIFSCQYHKKAQVQISVCFCSKSFVVRFCFNISTCSKRLSLSPKWLPMNHVKFEFGKPGPDLGYSALLPGWGDSEQIHGTAEAMWWLQAFGTDTKCLSAHSLQGQADYVPTPPPPHPCCQILGILGVRTPVVVSETWIPLKIKNMHSLWTETKDAIISLENVEVNNVMCKRIFSLLLKLWKITVKQLRIYVLMKDLLSNLCTSLY